MTFTEQMEKRRRASPRARLTGLIYLLYFLTAVLAALLVKGIVTEDARATAKNILAHQPLYRLSFALGLIGTALYIMLTALFYNLFKPVNKTLSLIAALFSLTGGVIQAFSSLLQLAPLILLDSNSHYLGVFTTEQLDAFAQLALNLHTQSSIIELVFFGFYDLLIGYLIFSSGFLPRFLGILMLLAGLGWLCVLSPPLLAFLSACVKILGFLSEFLLMAWLLLKGVNLQRWAALKETRITNG